MPIVRRLLRCLALLLAIVGSGVASAQTHIANTAHLGYRAADGERTVASNTVTLDVPAARQPTRLGLRLLPGGFALTGSDCQPGPTPTFTSTPVDAEQLAGAPPLAALDATTPIIIVLDAPGENSDPTVREVVRVEENDGAHVTSLPLLETGPDTGVFAGGFPPPLATGNTSACDMTDQHGTAITVNFPASARSLGANLSQPIEPAGFVFDSSTGAPVDGAQVTLLDAQGQPAQVFGDDGVSRYPSTVVTGAAVSDASGRAYPGETGQYHFPLAAAGRYTLMVVPPKGYTAPSTVSRTALAALPGYNGARYVITDASFGGAFSIDGKNPIFADLPIDRGSQADLLLTKTASVRQASPGDFIQYRLQIGNRADRAVSGISVTDTLPVGLRYERGSARGGPEPVVSADDRTLTFAAPTIAAAGTAELRYVVTVAPGAPLGEALNQARAVGPGLASNVAAASVRVRALLFTDALTIVGRVTEGECGHPASARMGVSGVRLLLEDGTYVVTDRDGLYHVEGVRTGRHVIQMDRASLPAELRPIACDLDARRAGSAISRFVEGQGGTLQRVDFQLARTGAPVAAGDPLPITVADDATAAGARDWLQGQPRGIDWLFPAVDHNPRAPAVRVAIKHLPGQRVALTVNGRAPDPLTFDATDSDAAAGVAVSRWAGVPLDPGDNQLVARVLDGDGRLVTTLRRVVHLAGRGVKAAFAPRLSRLVADGLTRPLIAVRITDAAGRPVRAGTLVPFRVDQPYVAALDVALEQGRQLAGRERSATTARVEGDDGLAFVALQPTTHAGAVHVVVSLADDKQVRVSELRAWLSASAKEWVVVGFGAGTLGYATLDDHARALPRTERNRVLADGQLAFYAKGRIKGSWLLTIAYDSAHRYDPDRGLLGTIDPDRYYTVYGDGAEQGYDAATRRKLYVRLERRELYALFGDFETGFADAQLTRYSRTLNGVKAAYEGRRVRATGFAARPQSLYARDEIQGDGLSGPYRLTGRDIVPNSDKITIEVRDRFRSELIRSSRQLTRHIDYDIDTAAGTLRFREPVLSRDAALNPTFIVAEYELEGGDAGKLVVAGRAATSLAHGRVELGATGIRDETVGNATVAGIDAKVRVDRATQLRLEAAAGGRGGLGAGNAWLVEAEHHGRALDLLGYVRSQDAGFGVGQQNLVEAGTRKLGLDGHVQLTDTLGITGTAWVQDQLDTAGRRIAADVRMEYRRMTGTLFLGGQLADDTGVDGQDRQSRLLTAGGTRTLLGGKLDLSGQTQLALGGRNDSVDFPVRDQLTAGYRVVPGIRLLAGYEIAHGDAFTARTARIGFDVAPWTGAKLTSTLNQQAIGENGRRTFAQYGLAQSLPLGQRWTVDATLDANSTISGAIPQGAVINAFQPVASGGYIGPDQTNGGFVATTLGATYRAARWSWTGRIEYRDSDASTRFGLTSSLLRSLGAGQTLASAVRAYRLEDRSGAVATSATADLALALRPLGSRWSLLERLEAIHDGADAGFTDTNALGVPAFGAGDQVTTRLIDDLAVAYRTGRDGEPHRFEATVYVGAKYVRGRFADDLYDGFITVTGFDLRRNVARRFDIGVQGSVEHAWDRAATSFSAGPTIGASPGGNIWMTVGYNAAGYRDRDFEADRYTRSGPYVTLRVKFDQVSLASMARGVFGERR